MNKKETLALFAGAATLGTPGRKRCWPTTLRRDGEPWGDSGASPD